MINEKYKIELQKFIQEHLDQINTGDWLSIYEELKNAPYIGYFSYLMLESGIDIFSGENRLNNIPINYLFDCDDITSYILPKDIFRINNQAFYSCSNLKSVDLRGDNSLHSIGRYAFGFCSNLEEIYIPKSLRIVSKNAFAGCAKLTYAYYEGTKEEYQINLNSKLINTNENSLLIIKCKDGEIKVV